MPDHRLERTPETPVDVFHGLGFTTTVTKLLLSFLDSELVTEQREAALNDPRISSNEQGAFIAALDADRRLIALAMSQRPHVLLCWALEGNEQERQVVAYNPWSPPSAVDVAMEDLPSVRMQLPYRPVSQENWRKLLTDEDGDVRDSIASAFDIHERLGNPAEDREQARFGMRSLF